MKVIGTGLPRTGTLSLKVALDLLGFGPCYHMVNVLADPPLVAQWQAALEGHGDLAATLDGYESTVDWPGGYFCKELLELYPNAKVVHSVRAPENWERSMRETVWGIYHGPQLIRHMSDARACVDPEWAAYVKMMWGLLWDETGTLHEGYRDGSGLVSGFEAWTEEVKASVPADQLLVYDVTQGWEPLCDFLEVPVPDEPMPRVNDGEEFKRRIIEISLLKLQAYWAANGGPVTGATSAASPVH